MEWINYTNGNPVVRLILMLFPNNGNKYIGIWLRVSTEFQMKDDSPKYHEKRARLYA